LVNHLEKLFLTSDAATIIRELEVVHPAAKILVMASQQQDSEQGDATNLVLMFAGELLGKAENLLHIGLHPSDIVQGYEMAAKHCAEVIEGLTVECVDDLKQEGALEKAVTAAVSAKNHGQEQLLTPLVVEAAKMIMPKNQSNFNVDCVRVVKILGGSMYDSRVVKGMVFGREPESVMRKASDAKVAIFSCPIDVGQTETKGTVLLKSAKEMVDYSHGEETQMEKAIKELADAGVKVVVSGGVIGELALHCINRYEIMAVKVLSKFDLRRLCRVVGATALARFV
jgi:T-complex protein 1 subunit theta